MFGIGQHHTHNRRTGTTLHLALGITWLAVLGFTWPWQVHGPWPRSSENAISPLAHRSIEEWLAEETVDPGEGFVFAVYGDQRALADGEWQELVAGIAALKPPPHFIVDTGDIVRNGTYSDQFHMLAEILAPLSQLPYLVSVGNHELHNNEGELGRANTAAFLDYLDPSFDEERMYYRKDLGPVSFLFLDSNDWVYGDEGDEDGPALAGRGGAQLHWLLGELDSVKDRPASVVVMHHPLVQSSRKHRKTSQALWSIQVEGRNLAHRFLDAGVDLVLAGHTHTYERFLLQRDDGGAMRLVNFSGRPRSSFLWMGDGARSARDIAGKEMEWLEEAGWRDLAGWRVIQEAAMVDNERNQFGLIAVDEAGGMVLELFFLDEGGSGGLRREAPVTLHAAQEQ